MRVALIALASMLLGGGLGALAARRRASDADATERTGVEVLAHASDAVIACGPDGVTITAWNPAAERLFGWSAEEIVGQRLPTLGDAAAEEERDEILERVRAGEAVSVVARRQRRDGTPIDVRINFSAITAADGTFEGWMGTVTDVTEEVALARERADRTALIERLNAVVADINRDLDLPEVLQRLTTSARELCDAEGSGFALVEADGRRIAAADGLLAEWVDYRFAEGEGAHLDAFARSEQMVFEDYESEPTRMRHLHGVGSAVVTPVELRGEHIGALAVMFAERGRHVSEAQLEALRLLAGHAGTAIANARAYGALVRGRSLAQEVLDRLPDGIAVLDEHGNVARWNQAAAQLTGLLAGEVLGRPFPWRTGTRAEPAEHHLRDGVWMETLARALPTAGGSMVVMRDVSRHLALQETKDLFLATASHELRTPLTVIIGHAQRLRDRGEELTPEERAASLDVLVRKSSDLVRTIQRLLTSSLAELGHLEIRTQHLDLGPLLVQAVTHLDAASPNHRVVADVEDGLPPVAADPHAVESILAQLLENAIKFSPDGGTVSVTASPGRDDVVVTVADEGVGLRPGDEERVFDRFARGSDRQGTGLGLFIVHRLVDAQGGRAWAQRRPGGGSIFSFSLPRS